MKTLGEYAFATLKVLTLVGMSFALGLKLANDTWRERYAEMAAIATNAQKTSIANTSSAG